MKQKYVTFKGVTSLSFGLFLACSLYHSLSVFAAFLAEQTGLSFQQFSLVASAPDMGGIVALLVVPALVNIEVHRIVSLFQCGIVITFAASGVAYLGGGHISLLCQLVIFNFFNGMFISLLFTWAQSISVRFTMPAEGDGTEEGTSFQLSSMIEASWAASQLGVSIVGALLSSLQWRDVFLLFAALLLPFVPVYYLILPQLSMSESTDATNLEKLEGEDSTETDVLLFQEEESTTSSLLYQVVTSWGIMSTCASTFWNGTFAGIYFIFVGTWYKNFFGFDSALVGLLVTVFGVGQIIASAMLVVFPTRFPLNPSLQWSGSCMTLLTLGLLFVNLVFEITESPKTALLFAASFLLFFISFLYQVFEALLIFQAVRVAPSDELATVSVSCCVAMLFLGGIVGINLMPLLWYAGEANACLGFMGACGVIMVLCAVVA